MNTFDFLFLIVAIVLTLGITELLGGVVRILRGDLKSNGLHYLWIAVTFQIQMQLAWGLWGLHGRTTWSYPEYLLLLTAPVTTYLIAALLYPSADVEHADALPGRPFFFLNTFYVVLTQLYGWLLFDEGWRPAPTFIRLLVIGVLLAAAFSEDRKVRWGVGLILLAGNLWWTFHYVFTMSTPSAGA